MGPYISLEQVCYTYSGREKPAVKNVTLSFACPERVAITGLNGSGKSTLARLIMGLLKPQRGEVLLEGRPVRHYTLAEVGTKLGYVWQNPGQGFFCTSVYQEIAFGLEWRGLRKSEIERICRSYLQFFGLWELRHRMPFHLSEGQKQLLAIAAALALEPRYLILDEPTKNIDTYRKKRLQEVLREIWRKGTGILVISHDLDFVSGFERRIHMAGGEVVEDAAGYSH